MEDSSNTENTSTSASNAVQQDRFLDRLSAQGMVYVLGRNEDIELCKVGYTSVSSESRASQYTDGSWVVYVEKRMPLWLARQTELATHKHLEEYWLDPGITEGRAREVFVCKPEIGAIALEIAYQEQLELSLIQLGVPKQFIEFLFDSGEPSDRWKILIENYKQLLPQLEELKEEKTQLKSTIADLRSYIEIMKPKLAKREPDH